MSLKGISGVNRIQAVPESGVFVKVSSTKDTRVESYIDGRNFSFDEIKLGGYSTIYC